MKANLAVMRTLQTQIDLIEKSLSAYCRSAPDYRLLNTVSGIGHILAAVILLETGDIARFSGAGNYASYCRCVGSIHVSNGKKKGEAPVASPKNFPTTCRWIVRNIAVDPKCLQSLIDGVSPAGNGSGLRQLIPKQRRT